MVFSISRVMYNFLTFKDRSLMASMSSSLGSPSSSSSLSFPPNLHSTSSRNSAISICRNSIKGSNFLRYSSKTLDDLFTSASIVSLWFTTQSSLGCTVLMIGSRDQNKFCAERIYYVILELLAVENILCNGSPS